MVDAPDLGSGEETCVGSSPTICMLYEPPIVIGFLLSTRGLGGRSRWYAACVSKRMVGTLRIDGRTRDSWEAPQNTTVAICGRSPHHGLRGNCFQKVSAIQSQFFESLESE